MLGGELCKKETLDEDAFKVAVQENLFNETGKLTLYFQDFVGRIVGRSASLEQTLIQIAREPGTLSRLSARMNIGTGTLKSWIDRVSDLIHASDGVHLPDTLYWPQVSGERFGALHTELRYFTDCIIEGRRPDRITPEESRAAVELMSAATESSQTGKVIYL